MVEPKPVTPETVADLPPQPLSEGVNGLPELSAHVAIMAKKPGTANDNDEERDARHS
jgi:hypothetical protein